MNPSGDLDDILDQAWAALEAGAPEKTLEIVEELTAAAAGTPAEVVALRVLARVELGELARAREALEAVGNRDGDPGVAHLVWAEGELLLREARPAEARECLERLAEGPDVLERRSLAAELLGDLAEADRLLERARRLDPEGFPPPPRLAEADFQRVLEGAVERLPEPFRDALEETEVVVEPVPALELLRPPGCAVDETLPPDLLGLFVGASHLERSQASSAEHPPRIYLFQRNLERLASDAAEVGEQIEVTLYHELGHLLGFDEEGLEEIGLD